MNEEQKNALELLKQYCQEDKDRLDFLETSIANRNIIVEDDGTIKYSNGKNVQLGETITKEQAEIELNREIEEKWNGIKGLILVPLNVNQQDALVSFAYNCGVQAFKNSTLLKKINANQLDEVPNQFMKWINANGKALPGLWRRRLAEALLFMGIKEIPSKYDNDYANMKYFPADWKKYI